MIDIDDLSTRIAAGIYGDDRMSRAELDDAMAALAALVEEVALLRKDCHTLRLWAEEAAAAENANAEDAKKERAAVVEFLRTMPEMDFDEVLWRITNGDHRKENP